MIAVKFCTNMHNFMKVQKRYSEKSTNVQSQNCQNWAYLVNLLVRLNLFTVSNSPFSLRVITVTLSVWCYSFHMIAGINKLIIIPQNVMS